MQQKRHHQLLKFVVWTSLAFSSLHYVNGIIGAKCGNKAPAIQQTVVSNSSPPRYKVDVYNSCPMCPVINIHLKCGSFPQALVSPKMLKVLGFNDCVVNGGLPLGPLQKFSFNYSHSKYLMHPGTWFFQCE